MKVRHMTYNIHNHRYWNTKDCPTEQKEGQRSATYLYKSAKSLVMRNRQFFIQAAEVSQVARAIGGSHTSGGKNVQSETTISQILIQQ